MTSICLLKIMRRPLTISGWLHKVPPYIFPNTLDHGLLSCLLGTEKVTATPCDLLVGYLPQDCLWLSLLITPTADRRGSLGILECVMGQSRCRMQPSLARLPRSLKQFTAWLRKHSNLGCFLFILKACKHLLLLSEWFLIAVWTESGKEVRFQGYLFYL